MSTMPIDPNMVGPPSELAAPRGLGALLGGLFGGGLGAAQAGVDPATATALRNQALMRMGLGMMAGRDAGLGFGQSAFSGLNAASADYQRAMQNAFQAKLLTRRDEREERQYNRQADQFDRDLQFRERAEDRRDKRLEAADRLAADTLRLREREAEATIAAARQGRQVDAEKLREAQEMARFARPLLEKLQRGESLTESELRLLNIVTGGTMQGLIGAQAQGRQWGLWDNSPAGPGAPLPDAKTLASDPDLFGD